MILNWPEVVAGEGRCFAAGGWVKKLQDIDTDKSGGYAYLGPFVAKARAGVTDCPDGLYVVCTIEDDPDGKSVKSAALFRVGGVVCQRESEWMVGDDWSLKLRDQAQELLNKKYNPLELFRTEDLINELKARGVPIAAGIREKMYLAKQVKDKE